MKISEMITKVLDSGIEAGKKVKEYMVDDTMKDLDKIMGNVMPSWKDIGICACSGQTESSGICPICGGRIFPADMRCDPACPYFSEQECDPMCKIRAKWQEFIATGKQVGENVESYIVDDTVKDLNKILSRKKRDE